RLEGELLPDESLFYQHSRRAAELDLNDLPPVVRSLPGGPEMYPHDLDALARGESQGLNRELSVYRQEKGAERVGVGKGAVFYLARDIVPAHQVTGEELRRLDLGGAPTRADRGDAARLQSIGQPGVQRI